MTLCLWKIDIEPAVISPVPSFPLPLPSTTLLLSFGSSKLNERFGFPDGIGHSEALAIAIEGAAGRGVPQPRHETNKKSSCSWCNRVQQSSRFM